MRRWRRQRCKLGIKIRILDSPSWPLFSPTISKERLFYHRQRLIKLFSEEIGSLDRTQHHGNVGTFGPRVVDGGVTSDCVVG